MEPLAGYFSQHHKDRLLAAIYWLFSGAALLFVFSSQEFYLPLRLLLVLGILMVTLATTLVINKILIPRLLFKEKIFQFTYGLAGLFCLSLWLILLTLIFVLFIGLSEKPDFKIPSHQEVLVLIFSSYLIIAFASVTHFIKESQKQYREKVGFEKQKQKAEIQLKKVQRQLLQSQIHPHFIYNILNSIYALTGEENQKVRKLVIDLSSMLDYMLYECRHEKVDLSREIQFLEDYISLEKIRFGEDLQVEFQKKLLSQEHQIAPLLLFPFVENAFKHGERRGRNMLYIKLLVWDHELEFEVHNKKGNATAVVNRKNAQGIGLKNVKERLEILYSGRYELKIEDKKENFSTNLKIHLE